VTKKVIVINVFIVECTIILFDDFGFFFLLHLRSSFSVFLAVFSEELAQFWRRSRFVLRLGARCRIPIILREVCPPWEFCRKAIIVADIGRPCRLRRAPFLRPAAPSWHWRLEICTKKSR
jgi:hypothetical protein